MHICEMCKCVCARAISPATPTLATCNYNLANLATDQYNLAFKSAVYTFTVIPPFQFFSMDLKNDIPDICARRSSGIGDFS